jgi:hypothetical protein
VILGLPALAKAGQQQGRWPATPRVPHINPQLLLYLYSLTSAIIVAFIMVDPGFVVD